jgi:nucleoside-diphosphate-sugar epimerase
MDLNPQKALIVGCGYVGRELAIALLSRGLHVTGWVRSEESGNEIRSLVDSLVVGDVADPEDWKEIQESFDVIVHAASSNRGGVDVYRRVYLEGVSRIYQFQPGARLYFLSSTSVYGQTQGEIVTEESLANPSSETSRVLRESEDVVLKNGGTVLRISGIYGPGRAVLVERMKKGEARLEGDGSRWLNQVHRNDVVGAVRHLLFKDVRGQIFNVTDDEPVTQIDYYRWCAAQLKMELPPVGEMGQQKRAITSKRVSNSKLRSFGWGLDFPNFRDGLGYLLNLGEL